MIQWLGLSALTAEGVGSIPGWGTKSSQAEQCGRKQINKPGSHNAFMRHEISYVGCSKCPEILN